MIESLYPYFERELLFAREESQEFARTYPAAAGRLLLESHKCADPHVERLIESFALIAARIQKKLDDDFPELTDALLNVLYPHYLAPVPSLAVVQFEPDPANPQQSGIQLPRHSLLRTQDVGDGPCVYRTCYDTTVWPIVLQEVKLQTPPLIDELAPPPQTAAVLRLRLACQAELRFEQLPLSKLRFHLAGDDRLTAELYRLITNHALRVELHGNRSLGAEQIIALEPHEALAQVGFAEDEGLLPYPAHAQPGYRLLTELFAYPEKFFFFDLCGLDQLASKRFGRELEVVIYLDRYDAVVHPAIRCETFRLGATPVVNLFSKICEPIALTQTRSQYRVLPEVRRPTELEVYSVDRVTSVDAYGVEEFRPFYSLTHDSPWSQEGAREAFWYTSRRESPSHDDAGSDAFLHLVDLNFDPHVPANGALAVHATCANRDMPVKLARLGEAIEFRLLAPAPVKAIRCIRTPTAPMRPPIGRGAQWRLISHLSLNHLSLCDGENSRRSLQEILRLYDFSDSRTGHERAIACREMIDGIIDLQCRRTTARIGGALRGDVCRGIEVELKLDESKYHGVGPFLFASVLERFFALYCSLNSFTRTVALTQQSGVIKRWSPRTGEAMLL